MESCPCQSGRDYSQCCGVYIEDRLTPPTAEALMRSRYTAYVQSNEYYLLKTWHKSTRPTNLTLDASQPDRWLGLKILSKQNGAEDDATGRVEFVARYKVQGKAGRLHEVSEFVKESGNWFYVKGNLLE